MAIKTVNVFGSSGFVGNAYCEQAKEFVIRNDRNDLLAHSSNVVYFISTVDNYNVHTNPHLDIDTNLVTFMKVLESFKDLVEREKPNTHCFNFISSWFVYGKDSGFGENARGIPETDSCDPKGFYSITKRCAEQLLMSYCETFNLNYRILRLGNVLGSGDKKVSAKKNALQYLINQIKDNKPVDLYDDGYFYRDYIDVRDCANAIDLVVNNGELNAIYNIGNGTPQTFRELLEYTVQATGSTSELRTIPQKEFHKKVQSSRSFYMDNTKLKTLGYEPKYDIFETIQDLISPNTK